MAVTIIKKPFEDYVPAYNDIEYLASGTATGSFNYHVSILVGSDQFIYRIPPDENGHCYFNLTTIAEKYVRNYYPFGLNGWQSFTDLAGVAIITFSEEYGGVVHSGVTEAVGFWAACLKVMDRAVFDPATLAPVSDIVWFNSIEPSSVGNAVSKIIKTWQDLVFYFYNPSTVGNLDEVLVGTFYKDDTGFNGVNVFRIDGAGVFPFVGINVSPDSINALEVASPGACIGSSFPTPFGNGENCYQVVFRNTGATITKSAFIEIEDECNSNLEEVFIHYQNRLGAFDSISTKKQRVNIDITRDFYRGVKPRFEASHTQNGNKVVSASPLSISKKVLSSTSEENINLITGYLNQDEIDRLEDLFDSSFVFIQTAFGQYQKVQVNDQGYSIRNKAIDRLVQVPISINTGITERRQYE